MTIKVGLRAWLAGVALGGVALGAQAASLEEVFRDYLARLRSSGQTLREVPLALGQRELAGKPVLEPRVDTLPLGREQYVVFVAPGCRTCAHALTRLREQGFHPEALDISRSATAREAFTLAGARGVPTVLVGTHRLSGYSDKAFKQAVVRSTIERNLEMQRQGQGS